MPVRTTGLWSQRGTFHIRSLRNLQATVEVVMSTMMMTVDLLMAVVALMEEEGQHTQDT